MANVVRIRVGARLGGPVESRSGAGVLSLEIERAVRAVAKAVGGSKEDVRQAARDVREAFPSLDDGEVAEVIRGIAS